jgi:hypothetical protein
MSEQSNLYDLNFRDVCTESADYHGPNLWGGYDGSPDYSTVHG